MTCVAQDGSHFEYILGQHFSHDLTLGERPHRISGAHLHIILLRVFLDGSGIRIEAWHGHLLVPSWENGCQVGKVGGRSKTSRKMKVLGMKLPIVENVPTPRESIFRLFAASQRPYRAKNKKMDREIRQTNLFIFPLYLLGSAAWTEPWKFH